MALEAVESRYRGLLSTVGKAGLNALFPNDFELYITAFELVDGNGNTEEYFVFPVNPESIQEVTTPLTNVKKTAGGISVFSTQTFVPTETTIKGNFGRQFKILVNRADITFSAFSFKGFSNSIDNLVSDFNASIKTGYGCIKVLERIVNKSNTIDTKTNKPYSLYFYNLALGNSYLCKVTTLTNSQNLQNNMIWEYSMTIKSLAKVENVKSDIDNQKSLSKNLIGKKVLQNASNLALNSARTWLKV